ncbi:E3 ubiquitin/ISG15 ligase TRIM25-like [Hyperolius riggenbachi]|uniref:E3 ubiquitin/ISG15 ligase TRIM25-like n=1 Tax=Hyperolius riggenbachi TaxID=752182 RepID=UPI0035A35320
MGSTELRKELECPVCLTIYTDPVMLTCGHNFCRDCIDRALNTQKGSARYSCPECRKRFRSRPALQRNRKLCNIVQHFLPSQPYQESGLFCTYCIHAPVPAAKTCLLCDACLCEEHLWVHSKAPEHVLCDPTTSPETRKCSVHNKILEYYCTEDAACVCESCRLEELHVGHQVEKLDETSEKKKKQLRNVLQNLMTENEEVQQRVQNLEDRRRKTLEKATGETKRVTTLLRDLRRRLEELEKRVLGDICRQAKQVSLLYDDVIKQQELRKEELSRKMRHIKKLCNMTDPLTVLQESDTGDLYDTEDRHDKELHDGGDLDVAGISHTLHTGLADIMSGVNVCFCSQNAADIMLDGNTAGNKLLITDDRKAASWSDITWNGPDTPERFQDFPQVMSLQSFSSGQHHWEVHVGLSDSWRVGVCYPSIDRKGINGSLTGYNHKSWGLYRNGSWYSVVHGSTVIRLLQKISSDTVRIYLDCEAGQISFYELSIPIRHLHTFLATFTEPLHAVLCVWAGSVTLSAGN